MGKTGNELVSTGRVVFKAERLLVRTATTEDTDLLYALWTNPQVMTYVGFPHGLRGTCGEIGKMLQAPGEVVFSRAHW